MAKDLRDLAYEDLLREMGDMGQRPYRAMQVYRWLYRKGASSFDEMTDVSVELRQGLKARFSLALPEVVALRMSSDGTTKFALGLCDGLAIESVIIPEPKRTTLCVSSQAGCALGCAFCMTGAMGFERNLSLSEMSAQVLRAREIWRDKGVITNVVLMGMGEPLLNVEEVLKFLGVLVDHNGFAVPRRRITVSTAGVVPGFERLKQGPGVNLAVSLNATTDETRSLLMPINRKYPLGTLIEAMRRYPLKPRQRITIEYVLIKGMNDSVDDARRLHVLLKGIPVKINLIPFNPHPGSPYERPPDEAVRAFWKTVSDLGHTAVIRASKGADIEAACGQLKGRLLNT